MRLPLQSRVCPSSKNPLQADFCDDKMEKQEPPSLPDDAAKSPVTKDVADETMADLSSKEERKRSPRVQPSQSTR